jgi:hypothetical protein
MIRGESSTNSLSLEFSANVLPKKADRVLSGPCRRTDCQITRIGNFRMFESVSREIVFACGVVTGLISGIFLGYSLAGEWKIRVRVWPFEVSIRGRSNKARGTEWLFDITPKGFEYDPCVDPK